MTHKMQQMLKILKRKYGSSKTEASMSDPRLKRAGVSGFNKPKRTPNHPKKSHVVVAKEGSKVKTIRFGQQGVTGDKKPEQHVRLHLKLVMQEHC
jgi:hypothetical protein